MQTLVQEMLRKPVPLIVSEDNTACIQAIRKGYSPQLRHLKRTQRVSVAQLHETFEERNAEHSGDGPVSLVHAETKSHKGDVFTKYMAPAPYREALGRLGVRSRRTRLAGGAAGVKVIDVSAGTQGPRTAQVGTPRRPRRQLRRTTPTPLPPTPSTTALPTTHHNATANHNNNATVNHNTNHNTTDLTQQHKRPRRRKRRRTTTQQPAVATTTP